MPSPKFVGKNVAVEFSIADETATPGSLVRTRLGAMRGKSLEGTWDTVDVTADTSAGNSKEMLATFFGMTFSGDGVSYGETISGQKALLSHFMNPGSGTQNQPKLWLWLTEPDGSVTVGAFMLTKFGKEYPYSDGTTWSLEATSIGPCTYTPT